MAITIETYRADPELTTLLERAARGELRLRINSDIDVYEVYVSDTNAEKSRKHFERREGIWKDYDIDRVRGALERARGVLEGVDADEMVQHIRADRSDDPINLSS
ncbi:MAG: hypothetical protein R3A46_17860 [Thermomicrobiales bacterium]